MNIGDTILVKGKIVDLDSNPAGPAIKIKLAGFMDSREKARIENDKGEWKGNKLVTYVQFWIHRVDQPEVLVDSGKIGQGHPV